ncbi:MAG: hypothetical protein E5W19_25775 [Mesorhizobium sp.]|nr:MAG: hypothetical protein E5W19_25775 [Mesorhizobium sp.]
MPSDLFASFSELLNLVSGLCLGGPAHARNRRFSGFLKKILRRPGIKRGPSGSCHQRGKSARDAKKRNKDLAK